MTGRALPQIVGFCLVASLAPGVSMAEAPQAQTPPAQTPPAQAPETEADDISRFRIPENAQADPEIGIVLPPGFTATVFHNGVGPARHLAVSPNGDLYVKLRKVVDGGGIVALRDEDGDGRADKEERFGQFGGTSVTFHEGNLYAASDVAVFRFILEGDSLRPAGEPQTIVQGFPEQKSHAAKAIAIDPSGNLYVGVGAPSNACQTLDRTKGVKGSDPCTQLEHGAGIWQFSAVRRGQAFSPDARYATGLRHVVAMAWNEAAGALFAAVHGRDQLDTLWPEHFNAEQNARLPAEEFVRIGKGDDFGWPYAYYDPERGARMVAPEYGGDGSKMAEAGKYRDPLLAFPAHWAPNGMTFYDAHQFPPAFQGGAFVAFHGSWNRAPLPQDGYKVVFVPFRDGAPTGDWQVFADGFAGRTQVKSSGDARYRPMGLAQGTDGSLYIADSVEGRIWKITYGGQQAER